MKERREETDLERKEGRKEGSQERKPRQEAKLEKRRNEGTRPS